ncbi:MAG: tetratricopeptide repeat protein [Sedimentisphaerales bacterium]|nr:tetratricopeptide repeat protein [Sedimentisphaerales bacterium]
MNDNEKYIEEFINDIPFDTPDDEHRENLKKRLLNAFPKHRLRQAVHTDSVWAKIAKSSTTRIAAAAVILIGVFTLTSVFVKTNRSVALAGVLETVEQTRAFMYKMEMTVTMFAKSPEKQQIKGTAVVSNEYGMKAQVEIIDPNIGKITQRIYLLLDQKLMLTLIPEKKKYMRVELDDHLLAGKKMENNDPREMMKQILACKYTRLGRSEINGIKVEGFKTTDPNFTAGVSDSVDVTLWVDVKTRLPVLWEIDMEKSEVMELHAVIYDYQWDIPVDESDFNPVLPADYTYMTDNGIVIVARKESPAMEHYERGEKHYLDGEYEQAFSELTEAIEIDPGLARAYVTRGMAYNDKGKHDLAIADFTRLIEIKQTDARAYNYRGMAYGNKGEYDLAVADYSKAVEIDPTIADSYKGRASAYYYKGEYEKAWKDVYKTQDLGQQFDSEFIEKLRKATRKDR